MTNDSLCLETDDSWNHAVESTFDSEIMALESGLSPAKVAVVVCDLDHELSRLDAVVDDLLDLGHGCVWAVLAWLMLYLWRMTAPCVNLGIMGEKRDELVMGENGLESMYE